MPPDAYPAPPAAGHSGLTEKQLLVVRLLYAAALAGEEPTFRGLMGPVGTVSTNGVRCHLRALVRKGWLRYDDRAPHFPYRLAGLALVPAFSGPQGDRLRRAVEGP
jgi:SOS-response transcriptional repressor LexA